MPAACPSDTPAHADQPILRYSAVGPSVTIENGRKRVSEASSATGAAGRFSIRERHKGYITWAAFERRIRRLVADNIIGKRFMNRAAVRPGEASLPGL